VSRVALRFRTKLIDFNYETEPLPGHFPTAFGLPGHEIPGLGPAMPAGKERTPAHA
jgi:hypothetical protein